MPIANLLDGTLQHVATVAKNRTGKRPSPSSINRWIRKGLRGGTIKLKAIYHMGYWQTTPEAFDEFLNRQTEYALSEKSTVDDSALEAAGLL